MYSYSLIAMRDLMFRKICYIASEFFKNRDICFCLEI